MNKKKRISWPSNEYVEQWVSEIPGVNEIKDYNYYVRASLIVGDITLDEYLAIENCLKTVRDCSANLSWRAQEVLAQILGDSF